MLDYLAEIDRIADSEFVHHNYRSLEGAIIIEWHWDSYVGYARKFETLRIGRYGEDESILIDVDQTYKTQYRVLAWPDELTGDNWNNSLMCLYEICDMGKWNNEGEAECAINRLFSIE